MQFGWGKAGLESKRRRVTFVIPEVPDSILPIVEMLPAQMLSIALSILHGHEPGEFGLISKITLAE